MAAKTTKAKKKAPAKKKPGRPPLFSSPEELAEEIERYFEEGGFPVPNNSEFKLYTLTGIWVYLHIAKSTWYDYANLDGFSEVIKNAQGRVEDNIVTLGMLGLIDRVVSIFALKNFFGWQDKPEDKNEGTDGNKLNLTVSVANCRPSEESATDGEHHPAPALCPPSFRKCLLSSYHTDIGQFFLQVLLISSCCVWYNRPSHLHGKGCLCKS